MPTSVYALSFRSRSARHTWKLIGAYFSVDGSNTRVIAKKLRKRFT